MPECVDDPVNPGALSRTALHHFTAASRVLRTPKLQRRRGPAWTRTTDLYIISVAL
jgi:hypothetical protein